MRMTECSHSLPSGVVQCPSLQILKNFLDVVLGNVLRVSLLEQRAWTRWPPAALPTWDSVMNFSPKSAKSSDLRVSAYFSPLPFLKNSLPSPR